MKTEIIDITVKPKRYQQDNVVPFYDDEPIKDSPNENEIPKNITIETAIKYFETAALGDKEILYKRTAGWLKILLSTQNKSTTVKSREAIQEIILKKEKEKMKDVSIENNGI